MSDVIADLRQAMAEFDRCNTPPARGFSTSAERASRMRAALRVLTLVRRLLAEVDGERAELRRVGEDGHWYPVEPLGGPVPGLHGAVLPE